MCAQLLQVPQVKVDAGSQSVNLELTVGDVTVFPDRVILQLDTTIIRSTDEPIERKLVAIYFDD